MKRILILLTSLLVVGNVVWADSRLESQFPRMAAHITNSGEELVATIEIRDDDVYFSFLCMTCGRVYGPRCDASGRLFPADTTLNIMRTREVSFTCGDRGDGWGHRDLSGNIDIITMSHGGSAGRASFQFLSPKEYKRYREARFKNVGVPFDTNDWAEKHQRATKVESPPTDKEGRQLVGTGTGFLVNENFIATADHVLRMSDRGDVCNAVSIMYRHDEYEASIADLDPANDIGLIKLSKPISSTAKIRGKPDLRLGETAINYGFPLTGELSTSAKITSGAVNSLAGYNNNSAFIQYDAASQFGNSGGPVLDASGNVIGVVSAKLDDADNQLVNFATKSTILEGFLKANKVPFEKADLGDKLELPDIAEKAETFTVLVGCWE